MPRPTVDEEEQTSYDGQNLEEVILGKILVGVVLVKLQIDVSQPRKKVQHSRRETYSPEVVHQNVEDTQDKNQERSAEFGLETNDDHDASNQADKGHTDSPHRPFAAENKPNEKEDQEHPAGQLEVHLTVLLVKSGKSSKSLRLPDPRVGQNHKQTTTDRKVSEEEVEVEDQAIAERLDDDDPYETGNGVIGVLSDNDKRRTGQHRDNVHDEEKMCQAGWNYRENASLAKEGHGGN